MSDVKTLGEALPEEIARVTGLIPIYAEIGPPGAFAVAMMRASLSRATTALAAGEIAEMIACHEDLKGYET